MGPPLNPPLQHNFISIVTRLQATVFIRKVNETAILMTSQLWRIRDPSSPKVSLGVLFRGGGLPYETDGDARRKF